jgi:hypothetical protein
MDKPKPPATRAHQTDKPPFDATRHTHRKPDVSHLPERRPLSLAHNPGVEECERIIRINTTPKALKLRQEVEKMKSIVAQWETSMTNLMVTIDNELLIIESRQWLERKKNINRAFEHKKSELEDMCMEVEKFKRIIEVDKKDIELNGVSYSRERIKSRHDSICKSLGELEIAERDFYPLLMQAMSTYRKNLETLAKEIETKYGPNSSAASSDDEWVKVEEPPKDKWVEVKAPHKDVWVSLARVPWDKDEYIED